MPALHGQRRDRDAWKFDECEFIDCIWVSERCQVRVATNSRNICFDFVFLNIANAVTMIVADGLSFHSISTGFLSSTGFDYFFFFYVFFRSKIGSRNRRKKMPEFDVHESIQPARSIRWHAHKAKLWMKNKIEADSVANSTMGRSVAGTDSERINDVQIASIMHKFTFSAFVWMYRCRLRCRRRHFGISLHRPVIAQRK